MSPPDLSALCEEIGRKAGAWAIETKVADKIAAMTTSERGREMLLEFAKTCFGEGLFRGLCDAGQALAPAPGGKVKKAWRDMPYAQQAAMRCAERGFQTFLGALDGDEAAGKLRMRLGVASRADIVRGTAAGDAWERIEGDYFAWRRSDAA